MRTDNDNFQVSRMPSGGAQTPLLTLDSMGSLYWPVGGGGTAGIVTDTGVGTRFYRNWSAGQNYDSTKGQWALTFHVNNNAYLSYTPAGGAQVNACIFYGTSSPVGDISITGNNATKNTGTVWINPSDIRLKRDVADYERGLADILKLEPIRYTLKACGTETCGFDAEAVREVFPECVSTARMKIDPTDEEDTDVLVFNMHPILVALVNAVKELAAAA
jgi:hypothetical protein